MTDDMLPDELVWREDGHLDDVAITAVADGASSIVPLRAREHLDACEPCCKRLGEAALLSMRAHAAVRALAPKPVEARPPLPLAMIAAALVLACLGAAPALRGIPSWVAGLTGSAARTVPLALRSAALLARGASAELGPWLGVLWIASAVVLVALGVAIARLLPARTPLSEEGAVR